jgi:methylglutaconyl-CoA hydratase
MNETGLVLESVLADGIVQLMLNRPEHRNALDKALMQALQHALAHHGSAPTTRVIVLSASGSTFCAGADLSAMRALGAGDLTENLTEATRLAQLLLTLHDCPKPTIALVQGPVVGGGAGLVSACDIAIGTPSATFRFPEVRLGLIPATISPYVIAAMGARRAHRYWLTGELMSAEQAATCGLLHELVAETHLHAQGLAFAHELSRGGPEALAACKRLLHQVAYESPSAALAAHTAELLAHRRATPEAQEGLLAGIERRKPTWRT